MAVTTSTKILCGLFFIIAFVVGEIYVWRLQPQLKAQILRAHFIVIIEVIMLMCSKFLWRNFKDFPANNVVLKRIKLSDPNIVKSLSNAENSDKWTPWQIFLMCFFFICHSSYITNYFLIGRDPYFIGYFCYASLGLFIEIACGLLIIKGVGYCFKTITKGKKYVTQRYCQLFALVFGFIVWICGIYNAASPPILKMVDIPVKDLPPSFNGFKIIQLSDIHLGPTVGRWRLKRIVDIVNEQNPDIVVMTGDLVDGSVNQLQDAVEPFRNINTKFGKYFISGNHEYYTGDVDNWFKHLQTLGFIVLHNSNVNLSAGLVSEDLCLAGVDDLDATKMGYTGHGMDIAKALGSCNRSKPVILLAHQPKAALAALKSEYRTDVILSGHTHGGQFFPVIMIAYFANPFFYGLYSYGESSHVYVSMGTQYWGIPLRIGTTMEVTHITLKPLQRS